MVSLFILIFILLFLYYILNIYYVISLAEVALKMQDIKENSSGANSSTQ